MLGVNCRLCTFEFFLCCILLILVVVFSLWCFTQIFEPFGPVELVQLPLDLETGHCKGFGFVQVSNDSS